MTLNIAVPQTSITPILMPKITVIGVGGAGGNAVNNMIESNLQDVNFVVANTDAQSLSRSRTDSQIQMGVKLTRGLGAGTKPEVGKDAAEECRDTIRKELEGSQMVFVTAGMGGGTGTGAAPIVAQIAKELNILTVGVVTKPFNFEGQKRMAFAEEGVKLLEPCVDTLLVIPNQNLFRVINDKTSISLAFKIADDVLVSAVRSITDLMRKDAPINLDFADVSTVMSGMGRAIMGTGEAEGEDRAVTAAQLAISNELLEDRSIRNAKALLVNISGGSDIGLQETEDAINTIKDELADSPGGTDDEPVFAFGLCEDPELEGKIRISVVATGIRGEKKTPMLKPSSKSRLSSAPSRPLAKTYEVDSQNSGLLQTTTSDELLQPSTQTEQIRKAMSDARLKIDNGQSKVPIQEHPELPPRNIHSSLEKNDNPNLNNVKFEKGDIKEKAESVFRPRGLLERYRRITGIKNKSENQQQFESYNEDTEINKPILEEQKAIDEDFLNNSTSQSKDVPKIGITLKPDIDESLPSPSDEELEIPAFLRRQAN